MISEYGRVVKILLTIGLLLFGGLGGALITTWFSRKLRVNADKEHSLKLENKGNCRSQYYLSIKKAPTDLKFTFLIDNIPLAPVFKEEKRDARQNEKKQVATTTSNPPTYIEAKKSTSNSKVTAVKPDSALKAGKDIGAKSGVLANLLGTLGSILPGSLGENLKKQAGSARNVQAKTAKATQAPQSAQRKMDSLKQSGRKLGVKESESEKNLRPMPKPRQKFEANNQNVFSTPAKNVAIKEKAPVEKMGFVQTQDIGAGESLLLTLRIGTKKNRYPVGSFSYTLKSQPMPLNQKLGKASLLEKKGLVHFEPIALWRYWLPTFSGLLMTLLILIGISYGLRFIWM